MIYAIQMGESGPIKFGVALNPSARLLELQTGNPEPLRLLAQVDYHNENERLLHYHLRAERVRGEWFKPTERTLALVKAMRECEPGTYRLTDHIYDADFEAVVWFRRTRLGFEIFEDEVEMAAALGIAFCSVARAPEPA